ncbi:hypothetical protein J2787_004625 [Chryseobacterium rhizosphaerae]|uniref:Uncharacterized protein n=1 Tax=Chryseobacterium rhizosphaerae TaxID=395937 RepID=A0AAE3YE00_9FLAO|nr:hypothetical protein [Chryseobacterium rhizosphaerae]
MFIFYPNLLVGKGENFKQMFEATHWNVGGN